MTANPGFYMSLCGNFMGFTGENKLINSPPNLVFLGFHVHNFKLQSPHTASQNVEFISVQMRKSFEILTAWKKCSNKYEHKTMQFMGKWATHSYTHTHIYHTKNCIKLHPSVDTEFKHQACCDVSNVSIYVCICLQRHWAGIHFFLMVMEMNRNWQL